MRRFARCLALSTILRALLVSAQPQVPRVTESIEVRITNVDVVVSDANGNKRLGPDSHRRLDAGGPSATVAVPQPSRPRNPRNAEDATLPT